MCGRKHRPWRKVTGGSLMNNSSLFSRRQALKLGATGLTSMALLAACGSTTATANAVSLEMSTWGDASRQKLTTQAIKDWKSLHSNVTIKLWNKDNSVY